MTIAAICADGSRHRFHTPEAFAEWVTSSRPRGVVRLLNADPQVSVRGFPALPAPDRDLDEKESIR